MDIIHLYDANGNRLWLLEVKSFNWDVCARLAQTICAGEGDGLLILNPENQQLWIINKDGSDGQFCGNGLQAAAFHLGQNADLTMAGQSIHAEVVGAGVELFFPYNAVIPKLITWRNVSAYALNVGNPHVIFIDPPPDWVLQKEAAECCAELGTNVHFVVKSSDFFITQTFERGAGVTAACGSGALAIFEVLRYLRAVQDYAKIKMPGGVLTVRSIPSKLCLKGQVKHLKSRVFKDASLS